jgi:signal transduction histidine kinase
MNLNIVEERTRKREAVSAQLFEAQKMDAIGQLTGGVAHDFNKLLMAILGSLTLLQKRPPESSDRHRLIQNAIEGARRGAILTQRLLAFSRRQELKPDSVDIARLDPDRTSGCRKTQYFPVFLALSDLLRSLANDELVGPLTIELEQEMPLFKGVLLIRISQLPL